MQMLSLLRRICRFGRPTPGVSHRMRFERPASNFRIEAGVDNLGWEFADIRPAVGVAIFPGGFPAGRGIDGFRHDAATCPTGQSSGQGPIDYGRKHQRQRGHRLDIGCSEVGARPSNAGNGDRAPSAVTGGALDP